MNPELPMENVYVCPKSHMTVTVDVDVGVTPFILKCRREGCDEFAQSRFYPKSPRHYSMPDPEWEWYRPGYEEYLLMEHDDHVEKGGLLIRRRTDRTPITHGDPRSCFEHPYWKNNEWRQELMLPEELRG